MFITIFCIQIGGTAIVGLVIFMSCLTALGSLAILNIHPYLG